MLARSVALATLMVFAASPPAAAQSTPATTGDIYGRVVNAGGNIPIAIATVDAASSVAGAPAVHASIGADGGFRIQNLAPGRYRVRIRAVGYAPRDLAPIDISPASPSVDVGSPRNIYDERSGDLSGVGSPQHYSRAVVQRELDVRQAAEAWSRPE